FNCIHTCHFSWSCLFSCVVALLALPSLPTRRSSDLIELLSDACRAFDEHCAVGIEPNLERIEHNLNQNLMLVTALNRHIGYDKAAAIAKHAQAEGLSLRDAALASGYLTAEQYDQWVVPANMTGA